MIASFIEDKSSGTISLEALDAIANERRLHAPVLCRVLAELLTKFRARPCGDWTAELVQVIATACVYHQPVWVSVLKSSVLVCLL